MKLARRLLAITLLLSMMLLVSCGPDKTETPVAATSETATKYKLGDVNGDGIINSSDYDLVRLSILGFESLTGDARKAADVNMDGNISIIDYSLIRLDVLGLKKIN
jgi:hypothetical protein